MIHLNPDETVLISYSGKHKDHYYVIITKNTGASIRSKRDVRSGNIHKNELDDTINDWLRSLR